MKNICALFIIDDNIASQLLKQEKEEISYQILHEEYFYRHLIDMQEFPIIQSYAKTARKNSILMIRSWQEINEILQNIHKEENVYRWEALLPKQLYMDDATARKSIQNGLADAEQLLERAVREQKYVMFYC